MRSTGYDLVEAQRARRGGERRRASPPSARDGGRRGRSRRHHAAGRPACDRLLGRHPAGGEARRAADRLLDHRRRQRAARCIEAARKAGALTLDAPVSGGVGGASAGTLTFMVGGAPAAFARAKPILEAMGKRIVHCGGAGAGQAAKICNNMILGATMIATCEAFVLAEKLGLSAQALFDVASTSSGQSWSLTGYCPVPGPVPASPANRDYKPGFAAALMLKDLRLAQEAAASVGAATPLGAAAAQLYALFAAAGGRATIFRRSLRCCARRLGAHASS